MIGVITVKVSAAKPSFPISTVPVFVGSDCTLAVADVPSVFYGVRLTSVSVSITNADGATVTAVCVRSGATWCATIPGAHFSGPGRVRAGLTVSACGTHEDGTTIGGWTLGRGDVDIMPADAVPVPGVSWQDVHLRDEVPEAPVKGDLAKVGGSWMLFTGSSWETLGGGGAVSSVNGKTGAVVLDAAAVGARPASWTPTAADVGARPASWTPTADDVGALSNRGGTVHGGIVMYGQTGATDLQVGAGGYGGSVVVYSGSASPASIKKDDKEVATEDQLTVVMELVGENPYSIKLDGVVLTFAKIKSIAESRHAVIRHGRGTYRVTYIGASEMMWDCTGTVQGEVQTGQIHIFADGDVVQLVAAKELAAKSAVDAVSAMAVYPMYDVVGGALKDRTINRSFSGGTFTFPARTGANARDFVLLIDALPEAPSVTFPGTPPNMYISDQPAADVWTAEAGKVNAWYFSEVTDGVFMVSHKAMGYVAQ